MKKILPLLLLAITLILTSCPDPVVSNSAPSISSISSTQMTMAIGSTVTLTANAVDSDGDDLTYTWSVSSGSLSSVTGQEVTYTAPDSIGNVSVILNVSDGYNPSVTDSLILTVQVSNEAVSGFVAQAYGYNIRLDWINPTATNFANVIVRRASDTYSSLPTAGDLVYEGTNQYVLDEDLDVGTTYYYSIWSKNNSGDYSNRLTASAVPFTPDTTAPLNVTNLSADASDSQISLSWTEAAADDLDHYEITFTPVQSGINQPVTVDAGTPGVVIQGLVNTVEYTFLIKSVDTSGNKSYGMSIKEAPVSSQGIDDSDLTPPSNVSSLAAVPGENQVTLSWTDPSDYDFAYASITFSPTQSEVAQPIVVPRGTSSVTVSPLKGATNFTFLVKSVDFNGNQSVGVSASSLVTDTTSPGTVSSVLFSSTGNGKGYLTWSNPSDFDFQYTTLEVDLFGGGILQWYYIATTIYSYTNPLNRSTTSLYLYEMCSLTYTVTLTALDYSGNEGDTVTYTFTPLDETAPQAPAGVSAIPVESGETVVLGWDLDGVDDDRVSVEISTAADGVIRTVVSESGSESMEITGLTNGTEYTFTLTALDYADNASAGTAVVTATPVDEIPGTVGTSSVTIDPEGGAVTLDWSDPDDSDLARIEVTFEPAVSGITQPVVIEPGVETCIMDGLTNGTEYDIDITPYDEANQAGTAVNILVTPSDVPPAKVSYLTATPDLDGEKVYLAWTNPTDPDFSHVELTITPEVATITAPVILNSESYTAEGLTNDTEYRFFLVSVDTADGESDSESIPATPTNPAPSDVTDLAVTANYSSGGNALLSWTEPEESDFTQVSITFTPAADGVTQPIIVDAGTMNRAVSGLTNGEFYTFTVQAGDVTGTYSTGVSAVPFVPWNTTAGSYAPGVIGPAGGWVLYDKGYYEDDWRYIEAAPENLGFAQNWYVTSGAETSVGSGKENTDLLVVGALETQAPRLCYDWVYAGYDDWFLPSKEALDLVYTVLTVNGVYLPNSGSALFWSSSNYQAVASYMYRVSLLSAVESYSIYSSNFYVLPFRRF